VINAIGVLESGIDSADDGSITRAIAVNAEFPHRVSELAYEHGACVLHVSTDAVFARAASRVSEDDAPAPEGIYALTKLLGESPARHVLNLRASIIGPDPARHRGLWAWLASQPAHARISGYTDQLWNGVTTSQFAALCAKLSRRETFDSVRKGGAVAHVCSQPPLTKGQLLALMAEQLRPDITVTPVASGKPVTRVLETRRGAISALLPRDAAWPAAIAEAQRAGLDQAPACSSKFITCSGLSKA
jgi:dTDP-4-dehydrorhamnose reductase